MDFVVKFFWIAQCHFKLHCRFVSDSHEIVIPRSLSWHHEEAQELVREDHLHFLEEVGAVVGLVGLHCGLLVLFSPFEAYICQLVDG